MSAKRTANKEDSAAIKKLVAEILKEQQRIDRHEGDAVACQVRIAARLTKLREQAKRTWGQQLKTMEISPRVASRYLKIAQHWPDEIGLNESDLLPRLPHDLLKLEWLCRVSQAQLRGLLDKLDCKRANRSAVIAAVRDVLGEPPPTEVEPDAEQFVQRLVQKIMKSVAQLGDKFPERQQQDYARELLVAGLREVQEALKVTAVPSEDA